MDLTVPKDIAQIVQALFAIAGSWVAIKSVNRWRAESLGKRQSELAEDVLAAMYEARDILAGARHPGAYGSEGETRTPLEGETESERKLRNAYFVPAEPLLRDHEFFGKLRTRLSEHATRETA